MDTIQHLTETDVKTTQFDWGLYRIQLSDYPHDLWKEKCGARRKPGEQMTSSLKRVSNG